MIVPAAAPSPQQASAGNPEQRAIERKALLAQLLGFNLRRISMRLSRDFALATSDYALRSGEFTSLAIIAANPGVSQNDICRANGLDKSAAVAVIDELLKRKWVVRKRSEQDRRRYVLTIAPQGEQALDDILGRTRRLEAPLLSGLTELEKTMLFGLLDKVMNHVIAEYR